MGTITQQERFRGALVGVLAGDALGAPYETWTAEQIMEDFKKRGGLVPHDYKNPWFRKTENIEYFPKGRPTDDSDHTTALAQSLIACNGLDEKDLFYRLRRIVVNGWSPLWEGKAVGAGRTTRKMLEPETYEKSHAISSEGAIPSNGSLMRASPLALYFAATRPCGGIEPYTVLKMSSVTHRHPVARECCVVYVAVLADILSGRYDPRASLERIHSSLPFTEGVEEVLENPTAAPRDPWVKPGTGDAVLTLHVALWVLLTTSSFREGITKAIALGGDTDTYAAVAGALLGAYYGEQGIPHEWREILLGRQEMVRLADEFCILANERA